VYCADVPDLYVQDKSCPVAWQKRWQQSEVRIVLRANRAPVRLVPTLFERKY